MNCQRARFVFDHCLHVSKREFAEMLRHLFSCEKCQAWFRRIIDSLNPAELKFLLAYYSRDFAPEDFERIEKEVG